MNEGVEGQGWSSRLDHVTATTIGGQGWPFRLSVLAGLGLTGAFLSVLFTVTGVVGGTLPLGIVVIGAFGLGALSANRIGMRAGVVAMAALFGLGLGGYLFAIPNLYQAVVSLELLADTVALLLGEMSLLQIFRADLWALSMAPAPVFGTWFLLLRRRYTLSVWVGGAALMFVVLTGDASEPVALIGATSALGVLGFGLLERTEGPWQQLREVGMLLAGVVVLTRVGKPLFDVIASSERGSTARGSSSDSSSRTIEGSLIDTSGRVDIRGSISLSTSRRFTVEADEPTYWQVGAFDRFTGRRWVRTGIPTAYSGPLPGPFGETQALEQRFSVESTIRAMPAAWKPVAVGGQVADRTRVTELGGLQATAAFDPGDSYTVWSERASWTVQRLRSVGDSVTDEIRRRYLQLPANTPQRLERFAAELVGGLDSRFDRAVRVRRWLTTNKGYSLDVSLPPGNVADAFVFEMNRGYCVYFASAMVVMLRSLGVPARFAVGYTTGRAVGDGRWEIRGLNSHAWVQVYFNQFGWVTFDPTPSADRREARAQRLVDGGLSSELGPTPDPPAEADGLSPTPTADDQSPDAAEEPGVPTPDDDAGATPTILDGLAATDGPDGAARPQPTELTRRALFTGLSDADRLAVFAGTAGLVLGVSRYRPLSRMSRAYRIRWQPRTDSPQTDIERAIERLDWVLASQYQERRVDQTRRSYLESIGGSDIDTHRLERILRLYERARYRGEVTRAGAEAIIDEVDAFVCEHHSLSNSIRQALWGR